MNDRIMKFFDKSSVDYWIEDSYNEVEVFERYWGNKRSILKELALRESFVEYVTDKYSAVQVGGRITSIIRGGERVSGVSDWKNHGKKMVEKYISSPSFDTLIDMNVKISVVEDYLNSESLPATSKPINEIKRIRSTILKKNQRLVYSVVKKYNKDEETEIDLLQEGSLGLIYAIDMFNNKAEIKFSTYATWWIRQYISKNLSRYDSPVHVPAGVQNLTKKALALFSEYGDMGRVAKELDIDVDKAYSLVGNPNSCSSLNEIIGDADSSVEKIDLLADNTSEANDKESAQKVQKMLTILDKREEMVVRLRFGLGVGKEYTLEEVGQVIGVTRERARQIEKKAVGKLKKAEMA